MTARRRQQRGFTLVEVMVSSIILLIGIAGSISAVNTGFNTRSHQHHLTTAITVAESVLEDLLLRFQDDADLEAGTHTGPSFDINAKRVTTGAKLASQWTVVDDTPIEGVKRVRVTVSWTDGTGARTLSLETHRK